MKKLGSELKNNWLYYAFLILPLITVLTGLNANFNFSPVSIGMVFRSFLLLLLVINIFTCKSKYKKYSLIYMGLLVAYGLLYFIFKIEHFTLSNLFAECKYMFKNFHFPVLLLGLFAYFEDHPYDKDKWRKLLVINLLVSLFFVIVPAVTNLGFPSYKDYYRGNVGWLYAGNEVGPMILMLVPILFIFLERKRIAFVLLMIASAFSIKLIGTKTAYLGFFVILLCYLFFYVLFKKSNQKLASVGLIALTIVASGLLLFKIDYNYAYFDGVASVNVNNIFTISGNNELDADDFDDIFGSDSNHSHKPNGADSSDSADNHNQTHKKSFLSILLSGRDGFYRRTLALYKNAPIQDKLLGLGYSRNIPLIEIDPLDHFFYNGIVGAALIYLPVLMIYASYIIKFFKNKLFKNYQLLYTMVISLMFVGISLMAGHIFTAPAVTTYFVFYFLALTDTNNKYIIDPTT